MQMLTWLRESSISWAFVVVALATQSIALSTGLSVVLQRLRCVTRNKAVTNCTDFASRQSAMQTSAAADRIATLQRHLQPQQTPNEIQTSVEPQVTKAESDPKERPAPGGGPGTLSVTDSRTGKKYEIPISDHGTIKGTDLKKITAGGDGVGIRPYDNG